MNEVKEYAGKIADRIKSSTSIKNSRENNKELYLFQMEMIEYLQKTINC